MVIATCCREVLKAMPGHYPPGRFHGAVCGLALRTLIDVNAHILLVLDLQYSTLLNSTLVAAPVRLAGLRIIITSAAA